VAGTAIRSGCDSVLLLHPPHLPAGWLERVRRHRLLGSAKVETLPFSGGFDPANPAHWRQVGPKLEAKFLWLPWNFVPDKRLLQELVKSAERSGVTVRFSWPGQPLGWATPVAVVRPEGSDAGEIPTLVESAPATVELPEPAGWVADSKRGRCRAERELVRRSGKAWDGIYSKFNRWLCRPLLRALARTPVTPNIVTFMGLPLAVWSGYWFAQGHWSAYVIGSLLYFATVLVDELDGMLARLTLRESAFGCWLESFVDYATYIPVFGGMGVGLSRQYGRPWPAISVVLLFGVVMTFAVAVYHRKLASRHVQPGKYVPEYYRVLEADSANLISRVVRQIHFFLKKAALSHFVVIFSVLGLLPVLAAWR